MYNPELADKPAFADPLEPFLISLTVEVWTDGTASVSYEDPRNRNMPITANPVPLEDLIEVFNKIGMKDNVPELVGHGRRKILIEILADEQRLTALGLNEVGENLGR
jgi:hypothetical protein